MFYRGQGQSGKRKLETGTKRRPAFTAKAPRAPRRDAGGWNLSSRSSREGGEGESFSKPEQFFEQNRQLKESRNSRPSFDRRAGRGYGLKTKSVCIASSLIPALTLSLPLTRPRGLSAFSRTPFVISQMTQVSPRRRRNVPCVLDQATTSGGNIQRRTSKRGPPES